MEVLFDLLGVQGVPHAGFVAVDDEVARRALMWVEPTPVRERFAERYIDRAIERVDDLRATAKVSKVGYSHRTGIYRRG